MTIVTVTSSRPTEIEKGRARADNPLVKGGQNRIIRGRLWILRHARDLPFDGLLSFWQQCRSESTGISPCRRRTITSLLELCLKPGGFDGMICAGSSKSRMQTISQALLRRVRHLRPSQCRGTDLLRPLRPATSRAGKRRHRHLRRRPVPRAPRHGPRVAGFQRRRPAAARRAPSAIGHTRYSTTGSSHIRNAQPLTGNCRLRPDRHRPQRQSHQRRQGARRTRSRRARCSRPRVDSEIILNLLAQPDPRRPRQQSHRNRPPHRGRLFAGHHDRARIDRRARSPRLPPAVPSASWTTPGCSPAKPAPST